MNSFLSILLLFFDFYLRYRFEDPKDAKILFVALCSAREIWDTIRSVEKHDKIKEKVESQLKVPAQDTDESRSSVNQSVQHSDLSFRGGFKKEESVAPPPPSYGRRSFISIPTVSQELFKEILKLVPADYVAPPPPPPVLSIPSAPSYNRASFKGNQILTPPKRASILSTNPLPTIVEKSEQALNKPRKFSFNKSIHSNTNSQPENNDNSNLSFESSSNNLKPVSSQKRSKF